MFTANSTEALNIAIKGILDPGDHVITTVLEHNSVLRPLYECRRKGVEMTILTCDEYANISYEEMERQSEKYTGDHMYSCVKYDRKYDLFGECRKDCGKVWYSLYC